MRRSSLTKGLSVLAMLLLLSGAVQADVSQPITVYFTFSAPTDFYLMPVAVAHTGQATPELALQLLIQGPPANSSLYGNVPADTEILDFWIEDGIAHVDFSSEVLAGAGGSAAESLLISAVVNTLCRFAAIDQVQFLVEGEIIDSLGGHVEANEPFAPQWDVISYPSPFADVEGHWAEGNINAFFLTGLVEGYGDGTFRPQQDITRAEFLKLLVLINDAELVSPVEATFSDVTNEHWAYRFVETAVATGIVRPADYDGDTLAPSALLSRREMAVLLTRANGMESRAVELSEAELSYTDADQLPLWARGYVAVVTELGLMQGDDVGTFRPQSTATRAEATAVLTRQLGSGEENVRLVWAAAGIGQQWILLGGVARAFEGTVNARIIDANEHEYAATFTTASQGGPAWGFWAIMLPLPTVDEETTFQVEAFTISAEDGQMQDIVSWTIICHPQ